MGAYLPPVATVLIEQVPEVEIDGEFVYVTDRVDGQTIIRRAMPRRIAIRTFGAFAQALRDQREAEVAQVLQFPAAHS